MRDGFAAVRPRLRRFIINRLSQFQKKPFRASLDPHRFQVDPSRSRRPRASASPPISNASPSISFSSFALSPFAMAFKSILAFADSRSQRATASAVDKPESAPLV
jgi:hypothetical protein